MAEKTGRDLLVFRLFFIITFPVIHCGSTESSFFNRFFAPRREVGDYASFKAGRHHCTIAPRREFMPMSELAPTQVLKNLPHII
jgi:hypothetical protein